MASVDQPFDRMLAFAVALSRDGFDRDAERIYRLLLARAPEHPETDHAPAYYNLGMFYRRSGRVAEAEAPLRQAVALAPANPWYRLGLGMVLLSLGEFAEGWRYYDARTELPEVRGARPKGVPEWQGEDPSGKTVLVIREQGFGDQIQFARFAPHLKRLGAEVLLLCAPQLYRLFEHNLDVEVRSAEGRVHLAAPDYWIMGCSLARRLNLALDDISGAPYLAAPDPRPRPGGGLRIGLVTGGSSTHFNDAERSMSPQAAAALRALPAEVIGLSPEELGAGDFADTANVIAALDLVITVDTAVAHLAGAMGAPCWVLLPFANTDWRWLRERSDSPWYSSLRLYRQPARGDWESVVKDVERDLAAFMDTRGEDLPP